MAALAPIQRLSVSQATVAVAAAVEAPSEAPSQQVARVVVLAPCQAVGLAVWHRVWVQETLGAPVPPMIPLTVLVVVAAAQGQRARTPK